MPFLWSSCTCTKPYIARDSDFLNAMKSHPLRLFRQFLRLNSSKPFYVTTPIFYVNASPHLGHLYSMLLADTRIRWEQLKPQQTTFFTTGTDEHGLKIQAVAEKEGIEPKELVDRVSKNFKVLAQRANVKYDRFIRTTDQDHVDSVRHFWNLMTEKGLIRKGSHSGWYCVSDEAFYPETQIEEIVDSEGKTKKISKETGNEVVFQEEENYFFPLSAFQDQLVRFLELHPDFIKPQAKYTELLAELKSAKLPDLSVSRPSSRLKWGIEVPNDDSQKIYVWFDALVNYLTSAGYPNFEKSPWPATHVIGKDIMRFHCIYWPIFLMAAGIDLPKQVIVHSHWLSEGVKMSKSLGNVVDPMGMAAYYGCDPLRLFLMEQSSLATDCNFSESALHNHRSTIINKYANLPSRVGAAAFDIRGSLKYLQTGKFDDIDQIILEDKVSLKSGEDVIVLRDNLVASLSGLYATMNGHMENFEHMKAIKCWWEVIEQANLFFQATQPWLYSKAIQNAEYNEDANARRVMRNYIVYLTSEASRIATICMQPFMPSITRRMLDRLAVSTESRSAEFAVIGADANYGENGVKHDHLMRKVERKSSLKK